MHRTLKYLLLILMLAACGQDPSPEALMQPEILDMNAIVLENGMVSFVCTMNDTHAIADCGFSYSTEGQQTVNLQGIIVDDRHFAALSEALTIQGAYKYSAYAGNGRITLQRTGGSFDFSPAQTPTDPDNPDTPDNPDNPNDPDTPDNPTPTPPDGLRSMLVEVEAGANGWVYLPLCGSVDVSVDWGDGNLEAFKGEYSNDKWVSHKYGSSGIREVCIAGSVEVVTTQYPPYFMPYPEKILAVRRWGNLGATSYTCGLKYCENLAEVAADTLGALRNASVDAMFMGCKSLKTVPDSLFAWSSADNMSGVFIDCESLKSIPPHIFAKCSAVALFDYAFENCTSLTTIPEGLFDDCADVDSFLGAFSGCEGLKSVPVSLFDHNRRVRIFRDTFVGCKYVMNESPYTMIGSEKVHLYERRDYREEFTSPVEYDRCFGGVQSLFVPDPLWTDYSNIPESWK